MTKSIKIKTMSAPDRKDNDGNLTVYYSIFKNKYGTFLVASTEEGVCNLFIANNQKEALENLKKMWAGAFLVKDKKSLHKSVEMFFGNEKQEILLCLKGTPFQIKVWQAALEIPKGSIVSYKYIAQKIGHPRAIRAVGSALGANPIAYIIACHRVLRSCGELGGYKWGIERKKAMLKDEKKYRLVSSSDSV